METGYLHSRVKLWMSIRRLLFVMLIATTLSIFGLDYYFDYSCGS
jgi:hypothetical protein